MGCKITIDSASMMNKGLEVIEAKWLFDLKAEQIEVLVHPQSIIHSMVYFEDASVKAQMSIPDMRLPIQFALSYPNRLKNNINQLDLLKFNGLHFDLPDTKNFSNLALAFEAMKIGGNKPCVLNASNEVAVGAFLREEIAFTSISKVVETTLDTCDLVQNPSLDDLFDTDEMARQKANEIIKNLKN
jgi:1-deoxy-D-xylulose-5-phosphate reductoisomerase